MEHILEVLKEETASGEASWESVVSKLNPREQRMLPDVLRDQKRRGNYWRRVVIGADGKGVVTIVRGRHPNLVPESEA